MRLTVADDESACASSEATSEPMAAPACTAGASNPPDPPKPTDSTLVNTGAIIHFLFIRPRFVEIA